MIINAPTLEKILKTQVEKKKEENYYFDYNRFLSFCLALSSGKASVLSLLVSSLGIKEEELLLYYESLKELELLTDKDISILKKISLNYKSRDYSKEIQSIIDHLNQTVGRNFRDSKQTSTRLKSLLMTGNYTLDDFREMHVYFNKIWGSNPNMAKYLRPQTLYNSKFEQRIEESRFFFSELKKYEHDIHKLCLEFHSLIALEVFPKEQLVASETQNAEDFCSELPLSLQTTIIHWLKMGYSIEQIIETIYVTIEKWSQKPELASHISISKILDQKFPDRFRAVQNILKREKGKVHKSGVSDVEKWIKES